ncbi:MAG: substrate-binding domain-containing protein [Flavobacterium sp.]
MKTIKIAGVPEHFNLPWHLAIEHGAFEKVGIDLQWTDVPEGTGKMCQMLREGTADIAIILTEGIVKDIIGGNPSKIVQVYVDSPLIWGIHVAASSKFQFVEQLQSAKAAISRMGSGSHLMAYVNAAHQNWDYNQLQFEIIHTIDGAVTALTEGTADYFMWERFMTQPLVDQGIFRRIADCPSPWPCFVVAVRNEILEQNPQAIRSILSVINTQTKHFKAITQIECILAEKYKQKVEDINQWLDGTEWSQEPIDEEVLNNVQNQLLNLGIIDKTSTFAAMVKEV